MSLYQRLVGECGRCEHSTGTLPLLHRQSLTLSISYFIYNAMFRSFSYIRVICKLRISLILRNTNVSNHTNIKSYKQTHNLTHIHPHTIHSPQHCQCCVGVHSLGKRTRSLGADLVLSETGVGGWEIVSTAREFCLYSIVYLLLYIF